MSKLTEYAKLVPKTKVPNLLEGLTNQVMMSVNMLPEHEKRVIMKRRDTCNTCEFNSKNAKLIGYETEREDYHCSMCGCPIASRTASLLSNCGIEVWNAENPDHIMPLKWEAEKKMVKVSDFIVKKK